jgi:hypothetical protein
MGISIDEKRVYDASEGPTPVYVVGEFGVARVDTSDDLVGEFGLARECTARDAAGRAGRVAVATDEDVLVGVAGSETTEFEPLGVGPAVAVGYASDGHLLVAREDGTVLREEATDPREDAVHLRERDRNSEDGSDDAASWTELGNLAGVRAIDGDFVAAESGVYRATGIAQSATKTAGRSASSAGLHHVGLDDARDVSTAGVPLAATGDGLYKLGNGWMVEREGEFHVVSAAPDDTPGLGWAHAAGESRLLAHEDEEWRDVDLPVSGEVVALDHGGRENGTENVNGVGKANGGVYAVTDDGTFLLSVGDGWTHQILGLRGVTAVAAP